MSLESGRKLGLIASLISIILPIVAIIGAATIIVSVIVDAISRIGSGTVVGPFLGLSVGLIAFIIAIAAIGLVGLIMFLVAMHRLSSYFNEPRIFKNVLYAFILSIISGVVVFVYEFVFVLSSLNLQTGTTTPAPFVTTLGILAISTVFSIINAVLYMQAFNKLAEKSGVHDFKTTGLLYLIGTLLTIVLVGGLIVWISWIFAAMGFNKLKPTPNTTPIALYPTPTPLTTATQTKPCPNCGTQNMTDALYCSNCGKQLQ